MLKTYDITWFKEIVLLYQMNLSEENWISPNKFFNKIMTQNTKFTKQMTVLAGNVDVLDLPSHDPDLNPVEKFWRTLKVTINQKGIREVEAMTREVASYWENINHHGGFLHNFIISLTRQTNACAAAEGGVTNYFLNGDLKFIYYS